MMRKSITIDGRSLRLLNIWSMATRDWGVASDLCVLLSAAHVDARALNVARAHRDELGRLAEAAGESYAAALRSETGAENG